MAGRRQLVVADHRAAMCGTPHKTAPRRWAATYWWADCYLLSESVAGFDWIAAQKGDDIHLPFARRLNLEDSDRSLSGGDDQAVAGRLNDNARLPPFRTTARLRNRLFPLRFRPLNLGEIVHLGVDQDRLYVGRPQKIRRRNQFVKFVVQR